jgi:hypothetical protein
MSVTPYTEKSFFELTGNEINSLSLLRLFNVLLDNDRETKFMNIFRSYIINEGALQDVSFYTTYNVSNGDNWDNVSYNIYKNPHLWWIIALFNNIVNPFEDLVDGQLLSVLKEEYVYSLVKDLEKISSEE